MYNAIMGQAQTPHETMRGGGVDRHSAMIYQGGALFYLYTIKIIGDTLFSHHNASLHTSGDYILS